MGGTGRSGGKESCSRDVLFERIKKERIGFIVCKWCKNISRINSTQNLSSVQASDMLYDSVPRFWEVTRSHRCQSTRRSLKQAADTLQGPVLLNYACQSSSSIECLFPCLSTSNNYPQ